MKAILSLLVLWLACVSAVPMRDETEDSELQMALAEHSDAVEMENSKRTLPTDIKDSISTACCYYMKSKQLCVHKYVYDVCKYTCGCWDVLSYDSCKILKTYNRCHVPVFRNYCAKTCNYCPHLHKGPVPSAQPIVVPSEKPTTGPVSSAQPTTELPTQR